MIRRKPPTKTGAVKTDKAKIQATINQLTDGWNADERETGILLDHSSKRVYMETTHPATARHWFKYLWDDPNVKWDTNSDSVKLSLPQNYCRPPELILKPQYRSND